MKSFVAEGLGKESFAAELSSRLVQQEVFWEFLGRLQSVGVGNTLPKQLLPALAQPSSSELAKLMYCASVFTQTNDDRLKGLAQTIGLNSLLVAEDGAMKERCLRLLTDLGNFPGLKYAEQRFVGADESLLGLLNRRLSESLNTVPFDGRPLALTDYQKGVWDALPKFRAIAVSAPTSAGKSFLVVEHLCRLAERGEPFAAVYIAPTRALLAEVYQKVQARLVRADAVRVSTVPSLDSEKKPCQVFILTQERLHVLLSISDYCFDLVVVDEAQNLSDGARGMILHDCLETVVRRNPKAQVILLAPGADGLPEVARTMGITDIRSEMTSVSPVLQNRIVVTKVKGQDRMELSLLTENGARSSLGHVQSERGLQNEKTRLAAVALELGGTEGSLVYATGPTAAEKVATQLMNGSTIAEDTSLEELSNFVREHIHPEYRLAAMIRHGVAFHYGRMPSLLREALEASFRSRDSGLKYLVCTTTLFQGVNLPARNVFINTPTRGRRGDKLEHALLWNFAGRAGRLSQDVVGNVFLVDYDDWGVTPMNERARFQVSSAVTDALRSSFDQVVSALDGNMPVLLPWLDEPTRVRACAGLLMAKAARGTAHNFIARVIPKERVADVDSLVKAAQTAVDNVSLPPEILESNWTIDPFGLKRLYDRMLAKIAAGELQELIPLNPHETSVEHYTALFKRILREVYGNKTNFAALVATLAIPWMRGVPYPVLLSKWVSSNRRREERAADALAKENAGSQKRPRRGKKPAAVDTLIRQAFNLIEDVVRFQFVQLGKAYLDLLTLALRETGHSRDALPRLFDFSLALELGVSTTTGTSFVELGVSRIAASALEELFPDSNLTTVAARQVLLKLDVAASNLSPVIVAELNRLGLLQLPTASATVKPVH